MTVSELIQELQKMPQHYPVWLVTPSSREDGGLDADWHVVERIDIETGMGQIGAVVRIDGGA